MPLDFNKITGLKYTGNINNGNTVADNDASRAEMDATNRTNENENFTVPDFSSANPTGARRPLMGSGITREGLNYARVGQIYNTQYERPIGDEVPEDFGTTRFDRRATNTTVLNDLEDFRANEQSVFNKITSGVAKMGVTAATTYADSIFGTIAGLINVAVSAANGELTGGNGSFAGNTLNAFINNPVSRALNDITRGADEVFKNYYTERERNNKWYQNIFTANFLADTIIKNAGFTIGAAYGARTMAAGTAKLFGMNDARNAYKGLVAELGSKAEGKSASQILEGLRNGEITLENIDMAKQLEAAAKSLKKSEIALQMTGALFAGAGEARIEAINAADELEKDLLEKYGDIEQQREMDKSQVMERVQSEHPELFTLQMTDSNSAMLVPKDDNAKAYIDSLTKKIDDYYDNLLAEIQHQKAKVANAVFGMNLPLLTLGDIIQFGKFILGDYATDRITQTGIRSAASETVKEAVEKNGVKEGIESFVNAGYESAKDMSNTTLKSTARGLGNALTEMQEEMNQSWISSASKDYGAHKVDEFNYRLTNPDNEFATRKWYESMYQGLKDSWGNTDDWVEGFSGFFMGAIGLPGIRINHNGKKIDLSMEGGMWDAFRNDKKDASELSAVIDKINSRLQDPKFLNYYWGRIGHDATESAKSNAAGAGDEWAYRKAEQMQMINDIITFDSAGRLQDLEDIVESMSNVNDENVDQIKDIFENTIGGDIHGLTDRAFIERVHKNAEEMKDTLEKYKNVSRSIRQLYGSQYDEHVLNELIWKTVRIDSIEKQLSDWMDEAKTHLSTSIDEFKETDDKYKNKTDYQILGMYEFREYVDKHAALTDEDRRWAKETLLNVAKAQGEKNAYVKVLAKTSSDPDVIRKMMEIEAEDREIREAAVRRQITEDFIKTASVEDMKRHLLNDDNTVDDEVKDILMRLDNDGVANAKEFIGFVNIAGSVNTKLDEAAESKGMNDNDKEIMHKAWNTVVASAKGVGELLQKRTPVDFDIEGLTDDHLAIINDTIEEFAQIQEYAQYISQAAQNSNNAAAGNQTFTGDSNFKLPRSGKRVKIIITPDMKATDKNGNPVTGTYYISSTNGHIYDNNGNRITKEAEINTPYGKQTKYEEKIFVDVNRNPNNPSIPMPLVDAYNSNVSYLIFKPGVNTFIIDDSVEEPWNNNPVQPGPVPPAPPVQPAPGSQPPVAPVQPVPPAPPAPPAPPVAPVVPTNIPPQTPSGNNSSLSKSLVVVNATPKAASVQKGDVIGFAMKQKDGPIYLVDKDNDLLGELPMSSYERRQIHGLSELIETLRNEFDPAKVNANGMFFSELHTKASHSFIGIDSTNGDIPITRIKGIPANIKDIKFIVLTGKNNMTEFHCTDSSIQESDIVTTGAYSLSKGTVYMLIPRPLKYGEGQKYTPVACRKADMSPTVWQILKGSIVGDQIKDAIEDMLEAANNEDSQKIFDAKKSLQKWVYLRNNSSNRNANGKNDLFFVLDNRRIRVEVNHQPVGVASTVDEMIAILSSMNCGIDIRSELFDTDAGVDMFYERLVQTGLITTNINSFANVGRFFMNYFEPDGQGGGSFEHAEPVPANQVQPVIVQPQPAAVTRGSSYVNVVTNTGQQVSVSLEKLMNEDNGDLWLTDSDGSKFNWFDTVLEYGKDGADYIFAQATLADVTEKNAVNAIDDKWLLMSPSGEFGYDRGRGIIMNQSGIDILRSQLEARNNPQIPAPEPAVQTPAEPATPPNPEPPVGEPKPMLNNPDDIAVIESAMFGGFLQMSNTENRKSNAENDREFLEMMKQKTYKIPVAVSSLYNSFKKVNGKTFRGMGSEKNIRKALKGVVQDEVIDFIVEGIKTHPELKDMRPYDAFVALINAYSYDLADTYNEGVRKPAIKALDNFLQNYFSQFNIKVDYADLKSRLGNDVTAMFDVIAKTIYISEGGDINQMTMPEEFAHAYIELMGSVMSKRPENSDFTFLMNTVEETKIFKDVFNAYKDVYTKNGKPDMAKIKKEALGQALAAALVHNWEMQAETEKEKTFWDKLRELFEKIIQMFKDTDHMSFHSQIDKIAREILAGDVSRLRKVDDTGYRLLDYVETIENQNKMDGGKALSFMKYFNSIGNLITGSITYRRDGTVYRGKLDSLHDIDMIVPKSAHNIDIDKIYETKLNLDQVNMYDYIMQEPYFKKIKEDYPKCRFCAAYADRHERIITVNAVYSEDESLSERFAHYTGSYADRLDRFTEEERKQIYLFDFFLKNFDDKSVHDDIYDLDMVNSDIPRAEKLFMGRAKDIFDYQMWKDFNDLVDREFSDSRFLMMQKERNTKEAVDRAIELSTTIERDVDRSPSYSVSTDDWNYMLERGWTQESFDRLSDREKERAIDCVRV